MSAEVTCPGCGSRLRLRTAPGVTGFTCPRCLARIPSPAAERPQEAAAPRGSDPRTGVVETGGPPPAPAARNCPGCGRPTEPQWLLCPHCEEPLREYRHVPPDADADVRRDATRIGWLLILLAVVGAWPVLGLVAGVVAGAGRGDTESATAGAVALALLLAAGWVAAYLRGRKTGQAVHPGRVVLHALAVAGTFMLLGLALIVFLFVACLAALGGGWLKF